MRLVSKLKTCIDVNFYLSLQLPCKQSLDSATNVRLLVEVLIEKASGYRYSKFANFKWQ